MKIILIRHGEAGKNIGLVAPEEKDTLTIKGVKQAVKLAQDLKDQKISTIYCSHTMRCEQTLDEIVRERSDDMTIHFSKLLAPKMKNETYEKLKARMALFIDDLQYDHTDPETIVIISHLLPLEMMIYLLTSKRRRMENGEKVELDVSSVG